MKFKEFLNANYGEKYQQLALGVNFKAKKFMKIS